MTQQPEKKLIAATDTSWRSRLCAPIFTLGIIVILMGIITVWALNASNAGLPMYVFTAVLMTGALGLLTLLLVRVRKTLLSPLTMLRDWVHNIRSGNLSARIVDDGQSEFSELVKDVNALGDKIQSLSDDMQTQVSKQTKHIERKTHSLEIIYDVAASINVSRDLDDLLTRFLHTLKDVVNARAAVVRLVTEDNQMRLVSSIGLDDDLMAREQLIPSESCLCGSAYKEGKVLFQKNLNECDKIVGRNFFEQENNLGMIVVPLQYRDKTLGVYNLFVDNSGFDEPEDIEDLLTSIGRHLGMAIDKARSEDEANRLSIMEERTRLAHELHDSLAQTLASLRFQVRVLDETIRKGEEPSIWHELEQIENNLDEAYAELRELITHFRAPIDKRGLIPAVEHLVERFRNQTDISIYLQKEWNVLHLPPSIEVQALRIIQEALNNIRKHSQAHAVRVILRSDLQGDCHIIIEDDGIGMNIPKRANSNSASGEHIGLSIMDERAARIGGTVKIESEEGEGTRIILSFPHPGTVSPASNNSVQVELPVKQILP